MSGVLALRGVRVQNANAVSGLTYGFPAVSGFLGFVEALDLSLRGGSTSPRLFDGCAIVSHKHQMLTDSHYGVHQFALARRPIQPDGKTAPFVEEGRMHLTVTLLIDVQDSIEEFVDDPAVLEQRVLATVPTLRLAGGTVLDVRRVEYTDFSDDADEDRTAQRRVLMRCLPGFALVDRSELLSVHLKMLRHHNPECTALEAWMDFGALRYRSVAPDESGVSDWARVTLPEAGWFVPIATGYNAIAPLQRPGSVVSARDQNVPFAFVESVYGVGQWLSPHRSPDVSSLVWRYGHDGGGRYSFVNQFTPDSLSQEENA